MRGSWNTRGLLALLLLVALQLLLWKLRIHDSADSETLWIGVIDHYIEHQPMMVHAARRLLAGEFPLWNPYELSGLPFLSVSHIGLFYPPNLIFLWLDAPIADEVVLVAHLAFAAMCTWGLLRTWGAPHLAGVAAGLTFAWCGRMNTIVNQHSPLIGLTWMPLTIWLVELVLRRKRFAVPGFALVVCMQVLSGSPGAVIFNLEVAGLYTLIRLAPAALAGDWRGSVRMGVVLLGALTLGLALAAPQIAPTLELAQESARVANEVTLEEAVNVGAIPLRDLGEMLLTNRSRIEGFDFVHVHAGVLSLLGAVLGFGMRRFRPLYATGMGLCVFAALATTGGIVFELYFSTPMGEILRRPWKFMGVFGFGLALLTGVGTARLVAWAEGAARPWTSPVYVVALVLCVSLAALGAREGVAVPYLVAAGGLLVLGFAPRPALRRIAVIGLVALQAGQLFSAFENKKMRTARRPDALQRDAALWSALAELAGSQRIFISGRLWLDEGRMPKQGVLQGFYGTAGYESLAPRRQANFFEAARAESIVKRFSGTMVLSPKSDWRLMDRTSTRFYVLHPDEVLAKFLEERPLVGRKLGFRRVRVPEVPDAVVYERRSALPRARFESNVWFAANAEDANDALRRHRGEGVILEHLEHPIPAAGRRSATGRVEIRTLEDERVVLDVDADGPGFVVLSDSWYPGWRAWVDGSDAPIYRVDGLFRAVEVPAGASRVEFAYRPQSFAGGLLVGAGAWALLLLLLLRERRREPSAPPS